MPHLAVTENLRVFSPTKGFFTLVTSSERFLLILCVTKHFQQASEKQRNAWPAYDMELTDELHHLRARTTFREL